MIDPKPTTQPTTMTNEEWAAASPQQRREYKRAFWAAWNREYGLPEMSHHESAVAYDRDPHCWPSPPPPEPEEAEETEAANE